MKPHLFLLTLLLPLCAHAEPWKTVELWPDGAPNEEGQTVGAEEWKPIREDDPDITRLSNVTKPEIAIYPAPGEGAKPAVIVFPGGGYHILAMKHEGTMVAEWLNELGHTALVLKYRVPRRKDREPHAAALEDARQALEFVHSNAEAWKLDPEQIGVLGFSAGGNLAAHVAYGKDVSNRPENQRADFAVLVYPAYLLNEEATGLSEQFVVTDKSPPAFLIHAHDDRKGAHVDGSVRMYLALSAQNIPSELHVYREGGHGFGMLDRGLPVNQWPARCGDWLKAMRR